MIQMKYSAVPQPVYAIPDLSQDFNLHLSHPQPVSTHSVLQQATIFTAKCSKKFFLV